MPKLFVKKYLPCMIKNRFHALDEHYVSTKTRQMIYSAEGVFIIRYNGIFKQLVSDEPVEDRGDFVIDKSRYTEEVVLSQIPMDHIRVDIVEHHFCVGKQSSLHLVVEGRYPDAIHTASCPTTSTMGLTAGPEVHSRYIGFTPHEFYIHTAENMDNKLLIKEVNLLLSIIR